MPAVVGPVAAAADLVAAGPEGAVAFLAAAPQEIGNGLDNSFSIKA